MTATNESRRKVFLGMLGGAAGLAFGGGAAARIMVDQASKVFRLDGGGSSYAFGVNPGGQVQSLYWGAALAVGDKLPAAVLAEGNSSNEMPLSVTAYEFAGFGGGLTTEPALKVRFPDGVRDLDLRCVGHQDQGERIVLQLKDAKREVHVVLTYAMDEATGVLTRSAVVENRTGNWIQIDQMAAACLNLPVGDDYQLSFLSGRWAGEFMLQTRAITPGAFVLESRKGHLAPGQSLVCSEPRHHRRGFRTGVVWRIGLERQLAHQRRDGCDGRRARHCGLQPVRFQLPPEAWRKPGIARAPCRLFQ